MASGSVCMTEAAQRARRRFGRVNEAKLESWFGPEGLESLKIASGPLKIPVPIMGIPAVAIEGEIVGQPWWVVAARRLRREQIGGFGSLSDLIAEATAGKAQDMIYSKTGAIGVAAVTSHLWAQGAMPVAGANGAAPPGGTVPTRASTGALAQQNPGGTDTLHLTTWSGSATVIGTLLLTDLLFHTLTAANPGTASIPVSGLQTRYTGAAGTAQYAGGNFITNRIAVVLPATAHNITYTYTDQDNNAGASSGAMTGVAGAIVQRVDFATPTWAANFAAGDTGVRQLTAIQFSASPLTGQIEHSVQHPIALLPHPTVNVGWVLDGINSAFNLAQVQVGACLTFLEFMRSATTAANYTGALRLVSG